MRAVIVTGGNPPSKDLLLSYLKEDDYLIGVDKGCNALFEYGLKPKIILGDFDSASLEVISYYRELGVNLIKFDSEKDYSDTDLAYRKATEIGAKEILLFGATGTRMDHMLGNIGLLIKSLNDKVHLEIIDTNNRIYLIDKSTKIEGKSNGIISFHAACDVVNNINIRGAKYKLTNYDMTLFEPRAICNEFIGEDIEITFDSGIIMVIFSRD